MRKIYFLMLFFTTTFSIAQSYPYRNHTFFRAIRNVGNITESIALANCNTTYSRMTDFQFRDRVSIAIAQRLESKRFYQLDFGEGLNYYYLWASGDDEHEDWDYRIDAETASIQSVCPVPLDQDGDGVPDNVDNCPTEVGLPALNGCPRGPLQTIDIIDFKVNEPANQSFSTGSRFDFEFKIQGNYSYAANGYNQIDLFLYEGNTTSSSNEIGRIYWNRENDYDIIYNNYFTKDSWVTALKNYSTNQGQTFTLKVNYANQTETYTYSYPVTDSDGDGVPDDQDNCPNQAGPSSNSGCPLPGKVIIDKIEIKNISGTVIYDSSDSNNDDSPTLTQGEFYDFKVTLKNVGGQNVRPEFSHYYSGNSSLNIFNDCPVQSFARGSNLAPNSTRIKEYSLFIDSLMISNCTINSSGGYFFLFADDIDVPDTVASLQFFYSSSSSSKVNLDNFSLLESKNENYSVSIYDFSGQEILVKEVLDVQEENQLIQNLEKTGIYIIKSKHNTRKVYIDNN